MQWGFSSEFQVIGRNKISVPLEWYLPDLHQEHTFLFMQSSHFQHANWKKHRFNIKILVCPFPLVCLPTPEIQLETRKSLQLFGCVAYRWRRQLLWWWFVESALLFLQAILGKHDSNLTFDPEPCIFRVYIFLK